MSTIIDINALGDLTELKALIVVGMSFATCCWMMAFGTGLMED